MCGIAGIIYPTPNWDGEIREMLKKIEHRGDSAPTHVHFGKSILGSVRLKIVDQENGSQPFFNERYTVSVVSNGEIYNFKELKKKLEDKGHHFSSDCDTEVLVHLYEEYGIHFIHQLEGMFSFLLYDLEKDKFFGVRDFFGVKPFFYCKNNETLYVASEMKSFLGLNVEEYCELKPGHYITNEGIFQYYFGIDCKWHTTSTDVITSTVRNLIELAVKKRVQTNLPIAVFLSGGIDSTIVHQLCCKYHDDVTAIIVGEDSSEDVIYAKRFCKELNYKFHHIKTENKNLVSNIENIIYSIETFEPNAVRGSLLSIKLAEFAHNKGFKVVICGEGSDEIFAGYGDFSLIKNETKFQSKIINFLNDLYRTQLLRIDKTGMKYAVEVREPFLDRRLVEYALNIHPSLKIANDSFGEIMTKFILREAFKDILPNYIYKRKKMTLMEGAGIGGVEKGKGLLLNFAKNKMTDIQFKKAVATNLDYKLTDKEEAYCFEFFSKYYSKATFAKTRVFNAQKELNDN